MCLRAVQPGAPQVQPGGRTRGTGGERSEPGRRAGGQRYSTSVKAAGGGLLSFWVPSSFSEADSSSASESPTLIYSSSLAFIPFPCLLPSFPPSLPSCPLIVESHLMHECFITNTYFLSPVIFFPLFLLLFLPLFSDELFVSSIFHSLFSL